MRTRITLVFAVAALLFAGVVSGADFEKPPVWQKGERWHYTAYLRGEPDNVFYDLTWVAEAPGVIISYETMGGHDQKNYYGPNLEFVSVDGAAYDMMNGGKKYYTPVRRFVPPIPQFSWPLEPGKKWETCSENVVAPGGKHCSAFEVLRIETIDTPVRSFVAAVIEHRLNGKLLSRKWFAPDAKNIVREEQFVPSQNERLRLILVLDEMNLAESFTITKR